MDPNTKACIFQLSASGSSSRDAVAFVIEVAAPIGPQANTRYSISSAIHEGIYCPTSSVFLLSSLPQLSPANIRNSLKGEMAQADACGVQRCRRLRTPA
eukprot:6187555-Pleurochrysis_carterae.AAC.1